MVSARRSSEDELQEALRRSLPETGSEQEQKGRGEGRDRVSSPSGALLRASTKLSVEPPAPVPLDPERKDIRGGVTKIQKNHEEEHPGAGSVQSRNGRPHTTPGTPTSFKQLRGRERARAVLARNRDPKKPRP